MKTDDLLQKMRTQAKRVVRYCDTKTYLVPYERECLELATLFEKVDKALKEGEPLPADWRVERTS